MRLYTKPTHYTTTEGGKWIEWPLSYGPSIECLNELPSIIRKRFLWYGISIHSLAFHNPINKPRGSFVCWNCITGWEVPKNKKGSHLGISVLGKDKKSRKVKVRGCSMDSLDKLIAVVIVVAGILILAAAAELVYRGSQPQQPTDCSVSKGDVSER